MTCHILVENYPAPFVYGCCHHQIGHLAEDGRFLDETNTYWWVWRRLYVERENLPGFRWTISVEEIPLGRLVKRSRVI